MNAIIIDGVLFKLLVCVFVALVVFVVRY